MTVDPNYCAFDPNAFTPDPVPPPAPLPEVTLSDWRVALIDMGRFSDVEAAVLAAKESGTAEGLIAWQRFEYANHVFRSELIELAPLMGFTEAEVDESLSRARALASA